MSKKYLSLEEAAEQLGISTSDLNRLREKGNIRAFADRGTWKFKEEDVETLGRSREADSGVDVPLLASSDDSSVLDVEDDLGNQATVIRKGIISDDSSDSDVRLIFDDKMKVEEPAAAPVLDDSDSDVKLAPSAAGAGSDSDSDVKLAGASSAIFDAGSDSDVKLVTDEVPTAETSGSDSDVRLVSSDSSGEVKLTGSSIVGNAAGEGSAIGDEGAESSIIASESGISLGDGSGIALASDSGISLERPNDSGISLAGEGSVLLESDSGISLAGDMPLKSESGISLSPAGRGSGKKKSPGKGHEVTEGDDDLSGTIPLMDAPQAQEEDLLDTQMEVPNLSDSSEEDLFGSSSGDSTNVITLDDEEEESGYDVTADIPAGGVADTDEEELVSAEEDEEPVEISDDLVGEDDELSEDVFGAEDEDFASDDLESGESSAELPIAPRGMVAVAEQEWGTGVHLTLVFTTVLTLICGVVVFDMVRNMWHTDVARHSPMSTIFVDMLKDM
jgi:excisionase family DNA binding protein